ncbi:MAG: type IV conjugative transfer system lipoprotein TraV [Gammaproteobacteria bacterium]
MSQSKIVLIIISAMLLNACSSLNSNFECPMKPGVRCESLDQVNAQVDRGEIGNACPSCVTLRQPISYPNKTSSYFYKNEINLRNREPLRYGETVMRVWVAPYEDTSGNYHQESDIYTVVKPSHWIGYPPKESNTSED